MSLIQKALDKARGFRESQTKTESSQPWAHDPTGAVLEQELNEVQQRYAHRRRLFWRVVGVSLMALLVIGFSCWAIFASRTSNHVAQKNGAGHAAMKVISGNSCSLTGITKFGGKSMAVINGEILGVGDSISRDTVVKDIKGDTVLVDFRGKEIKLTL